MKLRNFLKFGLPIFAIAAIAVTLPVVLTACSDSKNSSGIKDNTPSSITLNDSNPYQPQELKVVMNGDSSQYSYQWYYKSLSSSSNGGLVSKSAAKLTSDDSSNSGINISEWTKIPSATTNTLDIASQYFYNGSAVGKEYVCEILNKNDNSKLYSQPTTINKPDWFKSANVVPTQLTNVSALQQASTLFTSTSLASLISSKDNQLVLQNSGDTQSLFTSVVKELGLTSDVSYVKSITLSFEKSNVKYTTMKLIAKVDLVQTKDPAQSYTWSAELYSNASQDNNYSFNLNSSTNELLVSNIQTEVADNSQATPLSAFTIDNGKITGLSAEGKKLTNIVIPENAGITSIGDYAFSNSDTTDATQKPSADKINNVLQSITIPSTVTQIGVGAFAYDEALTSITFDETSKLQSIGNGAFVGTPKLSEFTVPATVTSIGSKVFIDSGIQKLTFLGDSNVTLGSGAFSWCASLKEVKLPSNQTALPDYTFGQDTSLQSLDIPNTVSQLGIGTFQNSGITSLDLSKTKITALPESVFALTSKLTTVKLPETLTSIAILAFYESGIQSITIPSSVTTISVGNHDGGSFRGCKNLSTVTFEQGNGSGSLNIGKYAFVQCTALKQMTLPPRTNNIQYHAFTSSGITNLTILSKVAPTIDNNAFADVPKGLTINVVDSTVQSAVQSAVSGLSNLQIKVEVISSPSSSTHSFFTTTF